MRAGGQWQDKESLCDNDDDRDGLDDGCIIEVVHIDESNDVDIFSAVW